VRKSFQPDLRGVNGAVKNRHNLRVGKFSLKPPSTARISVGGAIIVVKVDAANGGLVLKAPVTPPNWLIA